MKRLHPTLLFLLKALVSLGLLSFLLARVDVAQLLRALVSARPSYLGIVLGVYLLGQILCSFRWLLLARPLGFRNPFRDFVTIYFIGMFFNLFAPSIVGGDVGRVFYLARDHANGEQRSWGGSTACAAVSVLADRAIGMGVLVWVGAVALVLFPSYPVPAIIRYLTFALALSFFLGWFFLPLGNRFFGGQKFAAGENLRRAFRSYAKSRSILLQVAGLSLIGHIIQAWMQILLGSALDVEIPWSYALILYPLVGLFSALPISVNGIGLREGGYLFLLQLIGVSAEKAIAFGILWFVIVALDSLIGGVVFILRKAPRPSAIAPEVGGQAK